MVYPVWHAVLERAGGSTEVYRWTGKTMQSESPLSSGDCLGQRAEGPYRALKIAVVKRWQAICAWFGRTGYN